MKPCTKKLEKKISALCAAFRTEIKRIDQVNKMQVKAVASALAAVNKDNEKTETNTRESFAKVNEFRGALEDLSKTMATRRELEDFKTINNALHEEIRSQIQVLSSRLDKAPELHALTSRVDMTKGVAQGVNATLNYTHIIITIIVAAAALYISTH